MARHRFVPNPRITNLIIRARKHFLIFTVGADSFDMSMLLVESGCGKLLV